jgi:Glycosyltransferase family 87
MTARSENDRSIPTGEARLTRWLRILCIFVIAASCAEFVIATTGVQIHHLPKSTDFASYYLAGAQARDGLSPYDREAIAARGRGLGFEYDQFPFLYPPPFALAMEPLASLSYPRARQVWMVLSTLFLLAALGVTSALAFRQARALGLEDSRRVWIVLAAFFPAALNSTSVHNDIRAGSVGALLFVSLATAAWAMCGFPSGGTAPQRADPGRPTPSSLGRDTVLGGSLFVASMAKLTTFALVPYIARRGALRAAAIAIGILVVAMIPAFVHWGPAIVPDYLEHVIFPSLRDEVAPPMNQSLDAFLSRLLIPSDTVRAPFDAPLLKEILSAVFGIAIAAATLRPLLPRRVAPGLLPVEMGLVLLATLLLMKLTWVQTLTAMLWVWPVTMLAILRSAERGAPWALRAGIVACLGFFLSSAHIPILWAGWRHGFLVVVTGVHMIGLLLLWGVCLQVLRHPAESSQ